MPNGEVRLRINSSDYLCHPNQRTSNYSNPEYPMLKASPGSYVAMKYLENGHITLPWNQQGKPQGGGTVYVYGTTQPSQAEMVADVLQWTSDGTGGDGRGFLVSTQNYDDDRCHQINNCVLSAERQVLFPNKIPGQPTAPGQEQWCESDVQIPNNQTLGTLTTYWVWQWPTDPNTDCIYPDGKDEYYISCADFTIEDAGAGEVKTVEEIATNTLVQENFQTKAVSSYASRTAYTTSRPIILDDWSKVIGTTAPVNAVWGTSCQSSVLAMQTAGDTGLPPSCLPGKWATGELFASVSSSILAAVKTDPTAYLWTSSGLAVGSTPTATPSATTQPSAAPYMNTTTASSASVQPSATAPQAFGSTYTTTETKNPITTETVYRTAASASGKSAQAGPLSSAASSSSGPDTSFATIMTISVPSAGTTASSAVCIAPSVSSNGTAEDVYVGRSNIAGEHIARHAHRRYARHLV